MPGMKKLDGGVFESMMRAQESLRSRWLEEGEKADTVYSVDIPEQHLTMRSETAVRIAIQTLKGIGVTGTYRITKG